MAKPATPRTRPASAPKNPRPPKCARTSTEASHGNSNPNSRTPDAAPVTPAGCSSAGQSVHGNAGREAGTTLRGSSCSSSSDCEPLTTANNQMSSGAEIERLKAKIEHLRRQVTQQANGPTSGSVTGVVAIHKPRGEAGSDFNLEEVMGFGDVENGRELYLSIMRTTKLATIQAGVNLHGEFREIEPDKLANIYRKVRDTHQYMDKHRFPGDWATAQLVKQYLKNHRKHACQMGRLAPRQKDSSTPSRSQGHRGSAVRLRHQNLANVDIDSDQGSNIDNEDD